MTHELRQIIADLEAGRCVPSMQKRAAEMLRVADEMRGALVLFKYAGEAGLIEGRGYWGRAVEAADSALSRAADLITYEEDTP